MAHRTHARTGSCSSWQPLPRRPGFLALHDASGRMAPRDDAEPRDRHRRRHVGRHRRALSQVQERSGEEGLRDASHHSRRRGMVVIFGIRLSSDVGWWTAIGGTGWTDATGRRPARTDRMMDDAVRQMEQPACSPVRSALAFCGLTASASRDLGNRHASPAHGWSCSPFLSGISTLLCDDRRGRQAAHPGLAGDPCRTGEALTDWALWLPGYGLTISPAVTLAAQTTNNVAGTMLNAFGDKRASRKSRRQAPWPHPAPLLLRRVSPSTVAPKERIAPDRARAPSASAVRRRADPARIACDEQAGDARASKIITFRLVRQPGRAPDVPRAGSHRQIDLRNDTLVEQQKVCRDRLYCTASLEADGGQSIVSLCSDRLDAVDDAR